VQTDKIVFVVKVSYLQDSPTLFILPRSGNEI